MGFITNSNSNSLLSSSTNSGTTSSLLNLQDVAVTSPSNDQLLTYESGMWINKSASTSSIMNSTDVSIYIPQNNDTLVYNATSNKWNNNSVLASKCDLVSGVLSSSQIPNTVVKSVNSVTTSNNNITLTTDNISEGTVHKFQHLPISESDVTNLSNDLSNCEKTSNKNIAGGYCPLDSSVLVPISNIPNISFSKISDFVT